MEWMLLLVVVLIVTVLIFARVSKTNPAQQPTPYEQRNSLLTPAERSFYGVLLQAVGPEFIVFSKVRVADLLKPIGGLARSEWQTAFNKISAKHFDFVLCDSQTLAAKMVIELDDRSHRKNVRKSRDVFLDTACASAKLDIKHVAAQRTYRVGELKAQLFGNEVTDTIADATPPKPGDRVNAQAFDLHMSPEGFAKLSSELKAVHGGAPQVYIHVGAEGELKNQVLRIGRAKNGTYNRWMQAVSGHKNTFFWAVGESDGYTRKNAVKYSNYLLFFAALLNQKTKLYVIEVEAENMLAKEKELIKEYTPVWEQFRDTLKNSEEYPTLTGKNKNLAIVNAVAKLGAAQRLIFAQRKLSDDSAKKLPDVLSLGLRSEKEWSD
ncbi:MAG: DUF2726 domain-containing protein [Gammaproteobacteria bacterium]|nr:DUF2726 domain-containing protein [Gammaproteobacteria bacterium]